MHAVDDLQQHTCSTLVVIGNAFELKAEQLSMQKGNVDGLRLALKVQGCPHPLI